MPSVFFRDLSGVPYLFSNIEIVPQRMRNDDGYFGYEHFPRPHHGLIYVYTDICLEYIFPDNNKFFAKQGQIILAPKGCRYKVLYHNASNDCLLDCYTVNFDIFSPTGNEILLNDPLGPIAQGVSDEIFSLADQLSVACNDIQIDYLKITTAFTAYLSAVLSFHSNRAEYYPLRKGILELQHEWNQNESIAKYAALCRISNGYFHQLFRQWAGMTPIEYRNRLRISRAKIMLQNTTMHLGEISYTVGFSDVFYFSRVFRQLVGISPQKFRERNHNYKR